MSIRRNEYTTIHGERTISSSKTFKIEDRHFSREAKSQKSQLESAHQHGNRKDVKIKMNRKLT